MEPKFCPKCQGNLKPVYRDVFRIKGKYMTWDEGKNKAVRASPAEWLCENCREMFKIEVMGILC